MTIDDKLVMKSTSFQYGLVNMDMTQEALYYDDREMLFMCFPKRTKNTRHFWKLSLINIINECRAFCRIKDVEQVNLSLAQRMPENIGKLASRADAALERRSPIYRTLNKLYHLVNHGVFASTGDVLREVQNSVKRHAIFLHDLYQEQLKRVANG